MEVSPDQSPGQILRTARLEAGLTQEELANLIGKPQSLVAKVETGERSIEILEFLELCEKIGITYSKAINQLFNRESVLDEFEISEETLTQIVNQNPSLKGMILGYLAEFKFHELHLEHHHITEAAKDDDHDRSRKGDRRLRYKGVELVVEVKSLQSSTVKQIDEDTWTGASQVDASDRRSIKLKDGSSLETTLLLRGEFDILAVNCFKFGNQWRYVFALNKDLATSTYAKYPEEAREQLIASMQKIQWPPKPPFSSDFHQILERAISNK